MPRIVLIVFVFSALLNAGGHNDRLPAGREPPPGQDVVNWYSRANRNLGTVRRCASACNGYYFYVIGGISGSSTTRNWVRRYNPLADTWQYSDNLVHAVDGAAACYSARTGNIFVIGGGSNSNLVRHIQVINALSGQCSVYDSLPADSMMAYGPSAVAVGDSIYYLEGSQHPGRFWRYNPLNKTWARRADCTGVGSYGALCTKGGMVYAAGGWPRIAVFRRYHPLGDSWHTLDSLPMGRNGFGLDTLFNKIYAYGGGNGWNPVRNCYSYDLSTNTWTNEGSMVPGYGHTGGAYGALVFNGVGRLNAACGTADGSASNANCEQGMVDAPPVFDVGVSVIMAPVDTVDSGLVVAPTCSLYNYGNQSVSYNIRARIGAAYNFAASIVGHAPGAAAYVTFPSWTALPRGNLAVRCSTELTADVQPGNDRRAESVFVRVHDVGVSSIIAPAGRIDAGLAVVPACSVANFGNAVEFNYPVRLRIGGLYNNTATVAVHDPQTRVFVTFPSWTPLSPGSLMLSCSTGLGSDARRGNDKLSGSVEVVSPDIGATAVESPTGLIPPGLVTPQGRFHNYGANRYSPKVFYGINSLPPYVDSVALPGGLPVGADTVVSFRSWTAVAGEYTARCSTYLPQDANPSNNAASGSFSVHLYDIGVQQILFPVGLIETSAAVVPSALVKNFGDQPASFPVTFSIDTGGVSVYFGQVAVNALAGGADTTVDFAGWPKPHGLGIYSTRCSTFLAGDMNPANNVRAGAFTIIPGSGGGGGDSGWVRRADVPMGAKVKRVKDGGCLAYYGPSGRDRSDTAFVYSLKGNNRCEFYRFNVTANTWVAKESIPVLGRSGKKKAIKKGGAMAQALGMMYAAKGNNTVEWWQYNPALSGTPFYPWIQRADVPLGAKACKEGCGAAAVQVRDTFYIYFLKGSSTPEFYRYNTATDAWSTLTNAPLGTSGKAYKDGSCIAADEDGTAVLALKGTYNELFAYDVATNVWTSKAGMPLTGSAGKKKKVKSGAGIARHENQAFALKGNNTQEFWRYFADSNRWQQAADMPLGGGKRVKGGGALVFGAQPHPTLYALKGNNTLEFWSYGLAALEPAQAASTKLQAQAGFRSQSSGLSLTVVPTILRTPNSAIRIDYTRPTAGDADLTLYDVTGRPAATLSTGYHDAGTSSLLLRPSSLSSGIYILRLSTDSGTAFSKLVVE